MFIFRVSYLCAWNSSNHLGQFKTQRCCCQDRSLRVNLTSPAEIGVTQQKHSLGDSFVHLDCVFSQGSFCFFPFRLPGFFFITHCFISSSQWVGLPFFCFRHSCYIQWRCLCVSNNASWELILCQPACHSDPWQSSRFKVQGSRFKANCFSNVHIFSFVWPSETFVRLPQWLWRRNWQSCAKSFASSNMDVLQKRRTVWSFDIWIGKVSTTIHNETEKPMYNLCIPTYNFYNLSLFQVWQAWVNSHHFWPILFLK